MVLPIQTPNLIQFNTQADDGITIQMATVIATWDPELKRYTAQSVAVESPIEPITYKNIRLPMRRIVANGTRPGLLEANPEITKKYPAAKVWARSGKGRKMAKAKQENPTQDILDEAWIIMELERRVGGMPIRTVSRVMGIEYHIARRWADYFRRNRR